MQLQQATAAQQPSGHADPSSHHWGKRKKRSEANLQEPKHATAGGGEAGHPGTGGSPEGPDQNPSSDEPNPSQLDSLVLNPKLQLPSVPASSSSADAGQRTLPPRTPPAAATSPLPATAGPQNASQDERTTQRGPEQCAKDEAPQPGDTAGHAPARQIVGSGKGTSETAAPPAATVASTGAGAAGGKAALPKAAAALVPKSAGSTAHLPTGLHHLTRHWLPEGQRGEAVLQQLGAADLKAADHMIKNMGQRELRLAFQKVYQCETQSYNNNWLRRKLLEAVGLKATPPPRTLRGGGAGQGGSGSGSGSAVGGAGMTTRPHAARQPQRRAVSSQGHASASAGPLVAVGEVTKKVTRKAAAEEAEAEAVAALQTMMANKADGGCWGDEDVQAGCWEGGDGGHFGSWGEDRSEEREQESSMGGSQGIHAEQDLNWKQNGAEQEREQEPGEGPMRQHQQQQQEQRHQQHQEQEQQPSSMPLWHKPGAGREAADPVAGSKGSKLGSWDGSPSQPVEAHDGAAMGGGGQEGAGKDPMLEEFPAKQDDVWQQGSAVEVKAELASSGV
ncbi:hypothetical protein N2152v2_005284 [Parachlorella kessleri]